MHSSYEHVPDTPGGPPRKAWQVDPGRVTYGPCEADRDLFNQCRCFAHGRKVHWEAVVGSNPPSVCWLGRCSMYRPNGGCTAVWARELRTKSAVHWGDQTVELGRCSDWKRHCFLEPGPHTPWPNPRQKLGKTKQDPEAERLYLQKEGSLADKISWALSGVSLEAHLEALSHKVTEFWQTEETEEA
jgi:hypothetical protein